MRRGTQVSGEGTTLWAVRGGGVGSDDLYGVAVDGTGSIIGAGYYAAGAGSSATFGDAVLVSAGGFDAVMWKVGYCTQLVSSLSFISRSAKRTRASFQSFVLQNTRELPSAPRERGARR